MVVLVVSGWAAEVCLAADADASSAATAATSSSATGEQVSKSAADTGDAQVMGELAKGDRVRTWRPGIS